MNTRTLWGALSACLFAATAAVAQTEIKVGHVGEPGSIFAVSSEEFARRANAKLGGKAKVVVFGSSHDSWPEDVDDSLARSDWNWKPDYDANRFFDEYFLPEIRKRYGK